jgi:hypothetical protein
MRALLLILLLAAPWAWAQEKQQPAKEQPAPKPQAPARPLILRMDELPPSDRTGFTVRETAADKPQSKLPDLGGPPSSAYDTHRPDRAEDNYPSR